jgi:tripartite ATP-independent transporter DctM subunit
LLPPSHNAVIYSLASGGAVSIAHLFLAGIIPGILLGLSIMVLCLVVAYRRGFPKGEVVPLGKALGIAADALWGLLTIVIILGGILTGVFTATESGSIACLYAFFVTMFIYRECKWRDLPALLGRVARTVGMVMIMIGFSVAFAYLMALIRLPAMATEFFLTVSDNKYVLLMLINILLLVLGTFMDLAPMLLICTPILLPVIVKFGIDPVHFGMIMLLNLGIGLVTPPVGPTMVIGCAIGRVSMEEITKELWPFYGAMVIVLMLVTYVPELSLWLPSFLRL